jgi:hypothetical protein
LVERGKKAGDYYFIFKILKQMEKSSAKKDTNQGIFICEEKKAKKELGSYHFIGSSKDLTTLGDNQPIILLGCVQGTYKCSSKHTSSFLCGNTNEKKHLFLFSAWGR